MAVAVHAQVGAAAGPNHDQAKRIFELGKQAYVDGRYREAVDAFERVFNMTGHPVMLVNVGNAWARLDEPERAIAAFRQYLGLVPDAPEGPDLERRILELQSVAEARKAPPPAPPPAAPPPSNKGLLMGRTWTWVALAGSVVALGTASIAWTGTSSQYDTLARTCGQTAAGCPAADIAEVSGGVTLTNVALALAAIGLGTGTALWFIEGDDDDPGAARVEGSVDITTDRVRAVVHGHF